MCTLGVIEDETHFVVKCELYSEIRSQLFNEILNNAELSDVEDADKLIYLLKLHPRNLIYCKICCTRLFRTKK